MVGFVSAAEDQRENSATTKPVIEGEAVAVAAIAVNARTTVEIAASSRIAMGSTRKP